MKNRVIISERGTVTIPQYIREVANIHPGDLIEFKPEKDMIILKHLIIKHPDEEDFINDSEWDNFDKLVQKQLKKRQYTSYRDLNKAKEHSRRLLQKK